MLLLFAMLFQDPAVSQRAGEVAFRESRFADSVAAFDRVVAALPEQAPHHWQRGISLYYAGRFSDCKAQFELHRTVNPEDFENAAWHMLCAARIEGAEAARRKLIPIRSDTRTPMRELHALWRGQGSKQEVLAAAGQSAAGRFYAHLYLALWEEANGRRAQSREHAEQANTLAGPDYMGDVARVHWKALRENKLP